MARSAGLATVDAVTTMREGTLHDFPGVYRVCRLTGHSFRVLYLAMSPEGSSSPALHGLSGSVEGTR